MRTVPIEDLIEHPDNPREGDVGAIAVSMEQNGVYRPLVVQASTKFVLAGNHSLKAMRTLGHKRVPIVEVDVDDATARRIMLVDNRASDLASYDNQLLTDLLTDIARENPEALLGTGYDGDDLDELLKQWNSTMEPPESSVPASSAGVLKVTFDEAIRDDVRDCLTSAIAASGLEGVEVA